METLLGKYCSKYCIIRTSSAGVFAGILEKIEGSTASVKGARRLWYWDGAASLSELSQKGVSRPQNCKFPMEVPEVLLLGVIEVIPCSEEAQRCLSQVAAWSEAKND